MSDSPLERQVGGQHYKSMKIQPIEFIQANNLGFEEGNAVKYICRWKNKNGVQDLEKAIHYIQLLIEKHKKEQAALAEVSNISKVDVKGTLCTRFP